MVGPGIGSRIEQTNYVAAGLMKRGDVWSFGSIAVEACERNIFWRGDAAMLNRNDVIDFVRKERGPLRNAAILAAVRCAVANQGGKFGGNAFAHAALACSQARAFTSDMR